MASRPKRLLFTVIVVRTENLTINVSKCRINWPFPEPMEMPLSEGIVQTAFMLLKLCMHAIGAVVYRWW